MRTVAVQGDNVIVLFLLLAYRQAIALVVVVGIVNEAKRETRQETSTIFYSPRIYYDLSQKTKHEEKGYGYRILLGILGALSILADK